jgi:site-specific recombinase XerD
MSNALIPTFGDLASAEDFLGERAFNLDALCLTTQMKGSQTRTKRIEAPIAGAAIQAYLAASGRELATLSPEAPLRLAHDRATTMVGRKRWRDLRPDDPFGSHGFARKLKRYAQDAGLGDVLVHQTCHTFAALVGEDADTLAEVQETLHHGDLATTRCTWIGSCATRTRTARASPARSAWVDRPKRFAPNRA